MKKNLFYLFFIMFTVGMASTDPGKKNAVKPKKPNVLWLVVEDMSPFLSMYGNPFTKTPTIDALAKKSIVFTNAYSNGAQCSPARSTLISSIYAPMLATDWHREKRAVPQDFYFPRYLKEAGYYCTNNSKRDYNAKNVPSDIWSASNKKASYLNRADKSQPFFSVFNYNGTHTKRIATRNTKGRTPRTISLDSVTLPPYLPDVPSIRDDIAWYYDSVNEMDLWIKDKLEELENSGEADHTIVFFYSDHGGCLPRGKAYLYDTGTRVPLIIYLPEKYKHLAKNNTPSVNEKLVGFVDFAPTVFNLLDIEIPDFMMGKPFLGAHLPKPKTDLFLFRANQEQSFIPSRAITDGRFKLIWNFNTAYPNGTRQSYQWQMPSYQGWDQASINGTVNELQNVFWKPTEALEFFDTETDYYEVKNLIDAAEHQEQISKMKSKLIHFMKENKDLGLYPWSMRRRNKKTSFYEHVRSTNQSIEEVIDVAAFASTAKTSDLKKLITKLNTKNSAIRYWASVGILQLVERNLISNLPKKIIETFNNENENPEVRLMCAEILVKNNHHQKALNYILNQVKEDYFIAYATLQNLGKLAKPIESEIIELRKDKKLNQFYLKSALINTGYMTFDALWKP